MCVFLKPGEDLTRNSFIWNSKAGSSLTVWVWNISAPTNQYRSAFHDLGHLVRFGTKSVFFPENKMGVYFQHGSSTNCPVLWCNEEQKKFKET